MAASRAEEGAAGPFDVVDLIAVKRDGGALTAAQWSWLIREYTAGRVPEEQMAALAMAIVFRGMPEPELDALTRAMIDSGRRLEFGDVGRPVVDKHSTGGVGDKTTLILVPLLAASGVAVPQLSGRGLGHTGGTLDKLESIPGWSSTLDDGRLRAQLREVGGAVFAAGADLDPADARLYALRDVTGTVGSVPLIASSILSKKYAAGARRIVLDVKFGSGAFLSGFGRARELAETLVGLAGRLGMTATALLTDMGSPLGEAVGNACEVREALDVLDGGGPSDLVELTLALAREMAALAGVDDVDPAAALADGSAKRCWRALVRAQGGDPDAPLPEPAATRTVVADRDGMMLRLDARAVGVAAWRLGAGRARRGDLVDPAAGVLLHAKPGATVAAGDPIATLGTGDATRLGRALDAFDEAWELGDADRYEAPGPLVRDRLTT